MGASRNDSYAIVYFKRRATDDPQMAVPGREFLQRCPDKVRVTIQAVLSEVAASPPHRFAGGGMWEAMHGQLTGFHEVRVNGPGRRHYRLFCLLDTLALDSSGGRIGPLLVILGGAEKPLASTLSMSAYAEVQALGAEYQATNPRSLA